MRRLVVGIAEEDSMTRLLKKIKDGLIIFIVIESLFTLRTPELFLRFFTDSSELLIYNGHTQGAPCVLLLFGCVPVLVPNTPCDHDRETTSPLKNIAL